MPNSGFQTPLHALNSNAKIVKIFKMLLDSFFFYSSNTSNASRRITKVKDILFIVFICPTFVKFSYLVNTNL